MLWPNMSRSLSAKGVLVRARRAWSTRTVDPDVTSSPLQDDHWTPPHPKGELIAEYDQLVSSGALCDDAHQWRVVGTLQKLLHTLKGYQPSRPSLMARVSVCGGEGEGMMAL